jgi:hypothetical protein
MIKKEDEHIKVENEKGISLEEEVRLLKKIVADMEKELGKTNDILGHTTKSVTELKQALKDKNGKRRDYDILSSELMKKIIKKGGYTDYRDVKNIFNFNSNTEARRLMKRTVDNYPDNIGMKVLNSGERRKSVLYKIVN